MSERTDNTPRRAKGSGSDDLEIEAQFEEPKLEYIEPSIETHSIVDVTAGFFSTFYPEA